MAKIRYNGIIVDYNQLIKKQKQEVKKKISKIRKIIPPSNYTQENERCHMCWDPNTYEVNSCPYCYSSYEKTVIKNKKHDNEKNYQSDCAVKKVKVYDGSVNEDSIDNIYDNDLNSESDSESDSDIGQFFVFQSIDEIKKQEAVDRLLKVSNEAEELCQVVNEINVYDNKVNEIKVQNEITKKGRIFQEIKLTSDQIIKKKSKISGKKRMKKSSRVVL